MRENETNNEWLELYKKTNAERKIFAEKAWETIKIHIVLLSSLISITIGTLAVTHTSEIFLTLLDEKMKFLLNASLLILPIIMLRIIRTARLNFKRECKRMYEQISIIMKLEEKMGFLEERTENKQFKDDKGYFPKRYYDKWDNSEKFVKDMMKRKDTIYRNMRQIFSIFEIISYVLISLVVLIAILH